jgi:Xaa-Pro aminopeptidase
MVTEGLDAYVVFHAIRVAYLTGFFHQITERPIVLLLTPSGEQAMLAPKLEQEHIASVPGISKIATYPEYPTGGTQHPMAHRAGIPADLGMAKSGLTIGFDHDGPLDMNGYRGAPFSRIVADGVEAVEARELIDDLRAVKSVAETELIHESCRWADVAHRRLQDAIAIGRNELEIAHEASYQASLDMLAGLGADYQPLSRSFFQPWCGMPATLYLISGAKTAMPHGLPATAGIQSGDVLVTFATTDVGGYQSELERTMIVGEPIAEFRRYFDIMLQLQQIAFDALKPGRTLAEVELEVSSAFASFGVLEQQRHHTGHGIGLEGHEAPFIDKGDQTIVTEGMIFTVEPGIYVPGLAGFRHSDTVVVRANGIERLTEYPRELEALVVKP